MTGRPGLRAGIWRLGNAWHARLAARGAPAEGFVRPPEPRSIGHIARGRQLLSGTLALAGHDMALEGRSPWEVTPPDHAFVVSLHGFAWLDDLAALGDVEARRLAQAWVFSWIARYGRGRGAGWSPEITGRRLVHWVHHALWLLRGRNEDETRAFHAALAAQMRFLSRRAGAAPAGLARIEAWAGLLYAALSTKGMAQHVEPARKALSAECTRQIGEDGGIATRNPEELLHLFTLLTLVQGALGDAHHAPDTGLDQAIRRIAPVLRMLRHVDGSLARFHGGGRGIDGRLDFALATSGIKRRRLVREAMGYMRLSTGRSSLIVDAAPPPEGPASARAHASTLAFELTSGRRPLIVNCGPGRLFGPEWQRAGRASPSHSTLCLQGYSSARLHSPRRGAPEGVEWLEDGPHEVRTQLHQRANGWQFEGAHDAYVAINGLTHARSLELGYDGRSLLGEDYLVALDDAAKARFDAINARGADGVSFRIHFHLHPEADAALREGGDAASIALRSGEIWTLTCDGGAKMDIQPSVYFDSLRLEPRATQQVVLSGRAMGYATRVRWTLAKTQDTALAVRDLAMGEVD